MRRCRFSVLFISGLVLLAGCASGKAANQNASHSTSAPASAATSASAPGSATTSPAASSSPATVQVGQLTQEFAGSVPTDPAQASVIEGFREAQVLWLKSAEAWHLVAPVTQFVVGVALSHLNSAIAFDKQQGVAAGGTDQFFKTRVTGLSANSATVTTCDNGSMFTYMKKATGQVDNALAAPPNQQYLFENWGMARHSGHWAISSVAVITLPDPRARACQP